jgi:hypothetical protein
MDNTNYEALSCTLLFSPLISRFSVPETCHLRAVWISECYSRNGVYDLGHKHMGIIVL